MSALTALVVLLVVAAIAFANSVRILSEHQRGVVLRLGRYLTTVGLGMVLLVPAVDSMIVVDLRDQALPVEERMILEGHSAIARADVTYRVTDPVKATFAVSDLRAALQLRTGERLRQAVATGEVRTSRDEARLGERLRAEVASAASEWGIEIVGVEARISAAELEASTQS